MTEKEKMLAGVFYNTRDPELLKRRYEARRLMDEFNVLSAEDTQGRERVLHRLLGGIEKGVWLEKPFRCNYGENITIGQDTFINCNCMFSDDNKIEIGRNVMIAPGVQIYTVTHPIAASERIRTVEDGREDNRAPFRTYTKPVKVCNNAWIGGCAILLPGIIIGEGAVIGAGSVVTRDIPAYYVAVGTPCRPIKKIESEFLQRDER